MQPIHQQILSVLSLEQGGGIIWPAALEMESISSQYGDLSSDSLLKVELEGMAHMQVVWLGKDAKELKREDLEK